MDVDRIITFVTLPSLQAVIWQKLKSGARPATIYNRFTINRTSIGEQYDYSHRCAHSYAERQMAGDNSRARWAVLLEGIGWATGHPL